MKLEIDGCKYRVKCWRLISVKFTILVLKQESLDYYKYANCYDIMFTVYQESLEISRWFMLTQ
jgi:hypothetical protein